jgi:tetratricopeptide (TPR) repeat protein
MQSGESEFKDVGSCLKQADFEFKQRRYELSAPLYRRALAELRETRQPGDADIVFCIQSLADALALARDYDGALELYEELHQIRERQPGTNNYDLIAAKFKVAKMQDLIGNVGSAGARYSEALEVAQQSLYPDHPLTNSIASSYLDMVKRSSGAQELIARLSAKVNNAGKGIADSVFDSQHIREIEVLLPRPKPKQVAASGEEGKKISITIPPGVIKAVGIACIVCLVLAGVGAGVQFFTKQAKEKSEQAAKKAKLDAFTGKFYESIDGQDQLSFLPEGKVDSVVNGVKRALPFVVLAPGSAFSSGGMLGRSRSFQQVEDGMRADDGAMLYLKGSKGDGMVDRVRAIAAAAQKYFETHKEYPESAKDLFDLDQRVSVNAVTLSQDLIPVMDAGKERDWTPDTTPDVVQTLLYGTLLRGEPPLAPGAVHCYYFATGDKYLEGVKRLAFFIRACDPQGKFLSGENLEKSFVGILINGRPPNIAGLSQPSDPTSSDAPVELIKIIPSK